MIFFIYNFADAMMLNYENCLMPWEYGDSDKGSVVVKPFGGRCNFICNTQCTKNFSQSSVIGTTGVELNQDIIDQCQVSCKSGQSFSRKYRVEDNNSSNVFGWKWGPRASTYTSCTLNEKDPDSVNFAYYTVNFDVNPDDKVYISLATSDEGYGNTLFLCGFETKRITPNIFYPNTKFMPDGNPLWSPYNNSWFDTGVKIKKGDYIRFAYGGKFFENSPITSNNLDILFDGSCDGRNSFPGSDLATCFYRPQEDKHYCTNQYNQTIDCSMNADICAHYRTQNMKVNGYCSLMSKRHSIIRHALKIDNKLYNDYVFDQFQFEGIVGDLTSYGETLKIMYKHGAFIESGAFGGYEVEVTRKGCPHMDGDGLQYAIVKRKNGTYQPWDSSIKWSDAKPYIINTTATNKKLPINKSGKLYFRIDPSKIEGSRADTLGGYGIIVNKSNDKKKNGVSGTISTIVNKVTSFFIGEGGNNPNDGKVQNIFFKLVATPNFIKGVRALLMLYIIYTGISYMIGIAKTTQHEAIIRILKIAIVIMLISPNAWVFFNTYLFRVFLLGGMELTYDVVQPFTTITKINVENTNYHDLVRSVFSMYDTIYYQLFNSTIWIKIWALICTSLVGGLLALLIIIAIVIYTITTIRMVTIYLMSVITLSILFLVSPIFISFLLFEKTAKLFRSWINNMISMVFQPVFGFTAIAILYTIFLYTLYAALSFTACPTCLLSFDIFDWKLCLPANGVWWVVLYGAHFPMGSVGSVVDLIPAIIAVLILAQSMDGMVQFATNIANKIATNSFYGFGLDGVSKSTQGHVVSVISRATDVVLGVKEEAPNSNIKDGAKEGEKKRD